MNWHDSIWVQTRSRSGRSRSVSTQCLVPYSENKGYASNPRRFKHWSNRVWLQTCTCTLKTLPRVFFILFYFCLNLSTFYNSSQVVKTRKNKLKYNVTCNRRLHFLLPVTSLAFDRNPCQRRQDAVLVKRLKLI